MNEEVIDGAELLAIAAAMALMYPIAIVLMQVYTLLQHGEWIPVPAMHIFLPAPVRHDLYDPNDMLIWIPAFDSWLASPGNWLGIHHAVTWLLKTMNAGVFILIAMFAVYMGGIWAFFSAINTARRIRQDGFL